VPLVEQELLLYSGGNKFKIYTYINEGIMGAGAMTFEFHWKNMESWVGTKTFTLFQRILKGKD
jgi:hypothetical protein